MFTSLVYCIPRDTNQASAKYPGRGFLRKLSYFRPSNKRPITVLFTRNSPLIQLKEASIILIDKPLNWTSFDVVKKLKYAISKKIGVKARKFKIGHAGTLDPLATGLLVLCTGKATKQIPSLQETLKQYTGTITLGATTPSYDLETKIDQTFDVSNITADDCQKAAQHFIGQIEQTPPVFSAIWVDGKRAYDLARKGEEPKLKSRLVTISQFDIATENLPDISFEVTCTKGTYIRSLASDFGKVLNNGAHLSSLRRTRIGEYQVDNAWQIEEFIDFINTFDTNESI